MTDDRFTEFLKREARGYNTPPPTPRDEMWARIQTARRRNRHPWLTVAVAVAAVLVVGIAIGRMTAPQSVEPADALLATSDAETDALVYRVAAVDHLGQLDTFISLFRADAAAGRSDPDTGKWAQELLVTTRLMLDSPASEDVTIRQLLEDLELVLAQIAEYAEQRNQTELEMIEQDLQEQDVLLRLRAELSVSDPALSIRGEI